MKIIDKQNRGLLDEGRNNGMAFAFLEKKKDNFRTVQPLSPCKDYLAEVVFTERYDMPTKGCGLNYLKKLNIFSDVAYMVITILKSKRGSYDYSKSFENDVKLLAENHKQIERLMNDFEKQINLKILTEVTPANDDLFLVKFSADWCQSTHAISLYTLLLRVLMAATEKDKDIVSFLSSYSYHNGDKSLLNQNLNKIKLILKEKKLPPNTRNYSKEYLLKFMDSPHDNGITSWNSSFEDVPLQEKGIVKNDYYEEYYEEYYDDEDEW